MSAAAVKAPRAIVYPDSDGLPMSDNTKQFEYIVTIKEGLDAEYRHDPDVFVAGNLLWYPVEGQPTIRAAPDILFARGRPKGHRGSYMQWQEGRIAPQVVFEIKSPGNRVGELLQKFKFYEKYGVQEYYFYDPESGDLAGWIRSKEGLDEIPHMQGWVSPLLGVRFEVHDGDMHLFGRDNRRFLSYLELVEQWEASRRDAELAHEQARLTQDRLQTAVEHAKLAEDKAKAAVDKAKAAEDVAAKLAAQLRALGVEPKT